MRASALVLLLVSLLGCPGHATDPELGPPSEAPTPAASIPPAPGADEPGCQPRVDEVVFVTDADGLSVTIRGQGFCRGAGLPLARFGEQSLEQVVIDSAGESLSGRLRSMPPSGTPLRVHTPPGEPVLTDYRVP